MRLRFGSDVVAAAAAVVVVVVVVANIGAGIIAGVIAGWSCDVCSCSCGGCSMVVDGGKGSICLISSCGDGLEVERECW